MSWAAIASNQCVSFNNLQDAVTNGYFVALTGIPATQEQITKSDASTYVNIDTSYAPYAGKASNQLVVKSNLIPVSYAYTIYYEAACFYDGFYIEGGATSGNIACGNALTITLYSPVSSFANGMKLFYDSICSNFWYGDTGGCGQYYKVIVSGTSYSFTYADSSSTVGNLTACPVPLLRTFRVLNNDTVNQIELDVQINSVQEISPTVIPANSVITLTPQVDCTGFTSELLEYQIVSGYTPSSASFSNGSGTFTGTIAGGFITFTGIDLTPSGTQDLTVNP